MLIELALLRRENKEIDYLRPDAKSQVTIEYSDDNVPQRIDAIVISTQHDDFVKPSSNSKEDKKIAEDKMRSVRLFTRIVPRYHSITSLRFCPNLIPGVSPGYAATRLSEWLR